MEQTSTASAAIEALLQEFPHWQYQGDTLKTLYSFADFSTAMKVVTSVARAAEELHHHPRWVNDFNTLAFELTTHEQGNVVTEKDVELARAIEAIVAAHTE